MGLINSLGQLVVYQWYNLLKYGGVDAEIVLHRTAKIDKR